MNVNSQDFLYGGGEMGERIRSINWAETSLGPADTWPQSLKTCIRIILTSRQPMFIWWGDELINLYNDAYKAIVGGKHPQALGQPAKVVWKEIWDQVGPRAETVMSKNEGTYDEALLLIMERYGYAEETYYTFSYSPVPGDQGGTRGIICANTDDTQRIIGERQLTLLRELASRTADARTPLKACKFAAESLLSNLTDLPFAMIYLMNHEKQCLELAEAIGIERGHIASPERIFIDAESPWPAKEVLRDGQSVIIEYLNLKLKGLPTGTWFVPPSQGIVVPITQSGNLRKTGVLIVGLNPFRKFDKAYKGFIDLVAGQIASSIANAQAYEEERKRAEALAEIDKAKTVFFSNVSHELRTPLTLIMGPLEELIRKNTFVEGEDKEQIQLVYRNSLRLLKLVNTLLDFARLEAGRVKAAFKPVYINKITSELASVFRSAIENAGLKFNIIGEEINEEAYVDLTMWERIIFNLLSNAFKFTFNGEITVKIDKKGNAFEVSVQDTGTGIPDLEIQKLFSRFHRIENSKGRTHEGSGIGLAMVHELVKIHGGEIHAESKLGEGSTFTIKVPLGKDHLSQEQILNTEFSDYKTLNALPNLEDELRNFDSSTEIINYSELSLSTDKKKEKILIADDNADMREYINKLLKDKYEVIAVSDGIQALKALEKHIPSLILSDVMMPNLDGLGLLRKLRSDLKTSSIPIILLSARVGEEATIEGLEAGADDYLIKPFSAKELNSRITSAIKINQSRITAEKNIKNLFRQTPISICITKGPDHIIELANEKALELWGKELEDVINKPCMEAFPELAGQGFKEILDNVYLKGERFATTEQQVLLIRHKKPETLYLNFSYDPLYNEEKEVVGIMAIGIEITERKKAEHKLEELTKELEAANIRLLGSNQELLMSNEELADINKKLVKVNADLDNFIYTASHDLKAPIANLEGLLNALTKNKEFDPPSMHYLALMSSSIERFKSTIDDLTEISHTQKGTTEEKVTVNCQEMVEEVRLNIKELIEKYDPVFNINFEVPAIVYSRKNLRSIFYNLISNSIKYSSPERRAEISIETKYLGEYILLTHSDNGLGVSKENRERMFEMFRRFHTHVDGTGIGLYIIKRMIENEEGKIEVESELGKGTTFKVYFKVEDLS